jgi:rubredoxin
MLKRGQAITDVRGGGRWREMLRRWIVECPRCGQAWLVVGAREMDGHVCKACGHGFRIAPHAQEERPAAVERAGAKPRAEVQVGRQL